MRKLFFSFIVLMVVIGLPLISWVYLDSGLEYRKALVDGVKVKGNFNGSELMHLLKNTKTNDLEWCQGSTTLYLNERKILKDDIEAIFQQYKKANGFRIIRLSIRENVNSKYLNDISIVINNPGDLSTIPAATLVDYDCHIRNEYDQTDKAGLKKIVEHIAVVIKRKRDRDVATKNIEK